MVENISLVVAFSSGLLSFLSPCVLPLVPVYLVSICGPEILGSGARGSRVPVFWHTLTFVVGFSVVFLLLGAGVGLVGFALTSHLLIQNIAGGLLVALGLFMLAALKLPWLNFERRLTPSLGNTTGYLRSLLIGAIFSLAWTPCVGPILGGILTLALHSETAWQGAYLLAAYSLGLGLPFLIIGVAFDYVLPLLRRIQRYSGIIHIVSGFLLIAVGVLILTNKLGWFSSLAA